MNTASDFFSKMIGSWTSKWAQVRTREERGVRSERGVWSEWASERAARANELADEPISHQLPDFTLNILSQQPHQKWKRFVVFVQTTRSSLCYNITLSRRLPTSLTWCSIQHHSNGDGANQELHGDFFCVTRWNKKWKKLMDALPSDVSVSRRLKCRERDFVGWKGGWPDQQSHLLATARRSCKTRGLRLNHSQCLCSHKQGTMIIIRRKFCLFWTNPFTTRATVRGAIFFSRITVSKSFAPFVTYFH